MQLHSGTNQILSAGQLAVFPPLTAYTSTDMKHMGRHCFAFPLYRPQIEVLERQAVVAGMDPSSAGGLLFQQELSQGLHTDAEWITGVQKNDWQHRSDQQWLLTQRPIRPRVMISLKLQEKLLLFSVCDCAFEWFLIRSSSKLRILTNKKI